MQSIESGNELIVICGPTASGKTSLALELSRSFDIEVISADSRQVYRHMDIGTAKATSEEREKLPHHLIDVVDPDEEFSAADFEKLGRQAVEQIRSRSRLPVVVGGTGLYIQALTGGLAGVPSADPALRSELNAFAEQHGDEALYRRLQQSDPALATTVHFRNRVRIVRALEVYELSGRPLSDWQREHAFADRPYRTLTIGLCPPRELLYRRIEERTLAMIEEGLVAETRALLGRGYAPDLKAMQTLGYREIIEYLQGGISLEEAIELIQRRTRRYAKRQLTWFRRDENLISFDSAGEFAKIEALIADFLNNKRSGHA